MTDKIIWRRSFPNHFLIQHADKSDTCVVQNCHNLRRGNISQTCCELGLIWRNLNASLDLGKINRVGFCSVFPSSTSSPSTGARLWGVETIQGEQNWRCHFAVVRQTIVDKLIGLEMEDRMYCGQFGEQFNPYQITFMHAVWHLMNL